MPLNVVPIDLKQHADLCVQFRRDAMVCSFEDGAERFDQESGTDGQQYLDWLRQRVAEFPEGYVHFIENGRIVGQVEMNLRGQQTLGYVNLLYLIPEARDRGLGSQLHEYVMQVFQQMGVIKAQLSVSPNNPRAMKFYQKHGWQDLGPRPGQPEVHLMEISIL